MESFAVRWRILALLSIAELLGMSLWFGANAVASQLALRWTLDANQIGWLTTVVQLGFVTGTAIVAVLNIADVVPAKQLFAISALLGAVANLTILVAPSFAMVLFARFATGFFLAGVYPPAMKMISTWFVSHRGLAIGSIVGALTVGKSTPYLIHAIPSANAASVIGIASIFATGAALLVGLGYSDGPHKFSVRPFSWNLVGTVVRSRRWRLATTSYLGHMFELYAFWTWIGAFFTASAIAHMQGQTPSAAFTSMATFWTIAIGGAGCVWGGFYADRHGREKLVRIALLASGICSLLSVIVFGLRNELLIPFAMVWGFFVIADSAQFSALVTESVESHAVGTALALQTSLGFLLTMLPMQLVPKFAHEFGWRWALMFLALGPAAGIAAITRLRSRRASPS